MNFSRNTFTTNLLNYSGVHAGNGTNWNQWTGTSGSLNTELDYYFTNPADSGDKLNYRTWSPEESDMPTDLGGILSCKLDFANGIGDDHIILIVGFLNYKTGPQMSFVQTSVQFNGDDDNNIEGTPITSSDPAFDFPSAVYNALYSTIQGHYPGTDHTSEGRRMLATVAKANVAAFQGTVSF